jgi:hypothetical protein
MQYFKKVLESIRGTRTTRRLYEPCEEIATSLSSHGSSGQHPKSRKRWKRWKRWFLASVMLAKNTPARSPPSAEHVGNAMIKKRVIETRVELSSSAPRASRG